ncbi:MAG: aspartate aminotransferase family protein, partial [Planctomycetota bacterium]
QACATLWRESLHPTAPILSQTFTGSSASIACGLAILKGMEASGCFGDDGENMKRHAYFADKLASLAQRFPGQVKGPWGEGMMIAFTPGDGSFETAKKLVDDLYAAGLLAFLCGGNPTRVRFLPPPIVTTTAHIDMAIDILADVLSHTNNK